MKFVAKFLKSYKRAKTYTRNATYAAAIYQGMVVKK